jgi:nucleoside-diphosphate-sugar epimerase
MGTRINLRSRMRFAKNSAAAIRSRRKTVFIRYGYANRCWLSDQRKSQFDGGKKTNVEDIEARTESFRISGPDRSRHHAVNFGRMEHPSRKCRIGTVMLHLVTGGSGFVGSTIARLLSERGHAVRVFDLWRADDLPTTVEYIEGDINDRAAVERAMQGVTHVHHNVALLPLDKAGDRYWMVNVEGTRIALEEAKRAKVRMFAHMSSSAVFGSPDAMPITNLTPRQPVEIYGKAKKAGEDLVLKAQSEGMPASIIRPRTIVGAGRLGIFEILFDWVGDGANIYIIGKGSNLFQFVHVEDIAEASIQSCLKQVSGVFNVGTDRFSTLREDLEYLCNYARTGSRVKSLPVAPTIGVLQLLDKLRLSPLGPWHYLTYHKPFYFDSEPAYLALGFRPRYDNRAMLTSSYGWFIHNFDASLIKETASTHKSPVKQRILKFLKTIS